MGSFQPIESFDSAASLRREHFVGQHPEPFLVQSTETEQKLDPGRRDDLTSDRLVLQKPRKALLSQMLAAPLLPRDPDGDRVTVGVATTCDLVLDDASVSKRHAWFDQDDDGAWWIHDADSSAGTQVNNEPVVPGKPRVLVSGDRIALGFVEVMFISPEGFHDLIRGLFASVG